MIPYGKVAHAAIASTSLLAENYSSDGSVRLSSRQIAQKRGLSQAIVAKVLTSLSQAGVVIGSPGPHGGYALARSPQEISLHQVVAPFDRQESALACPFGEGWCGTGPQCPLHIRLESLRQQVADFLQRTTLASFSKTGPSGPASLPLSPATF
jgi:Rrf2 family transcriptional regulator, iron-sulfur cluster assembly transcription factor